MREARANVKAISELLEEAQKRNFGQKVVSTVAQLFPAAARVNTVIPVYFVAFGHQNIDAFVRRVIWRGDSPVFTGEGEGELTIVVNLAKCVNYGRSVDERFIGMLSIVAHEVFHAAFGVYKDGSPVWKNYYATIIPPYHQNIFGGNVGGPIFFKGFNKSKNKLFFWAGYEDMIQHPYNAPVVMNVPTADQRAGNFNNAGIPKAMYDPSNNSGIYSAVYALPCNSDDGWQGCSPATSPWGGYGTGPAPNLKAYFDPAGVIINNLNPAPNQTPWCEMARCF